MGTLPACTAPETYAYQRRSVLISISFSIRSFTKDRIAAFISVLDVSGKSALFREPLFLVVPINHPLAKAAAVSPDDLNGSDVLTLGDHYALTEQVRAICYKTGARVLDNYVGNTLDSLRIMTGMDMGVSIMPALYVKSEVIGRDAAVVAVPFKGQNVHRTMGLAWRKSTGKSAAINTVRAFIQNTTSDTFNGTLFVLDGTIA